MKPVKLISDRVWRTYTGGKLLEEWKGNGASGKDTQFPEEWIASTTKAVNPGREQLEEGLGKVDTPQGRITLQDLIASDPAGYLGEAHYKKYGADTGCLIKMLDSAERLTIQVHPDRENAMRLFSSKYGKTESWCIVNTREIDGEKPYILLGFRKGITKEKWKRLFFEQDIDGMLDCMHRIEVEKGDVYIVHGGVPHAIGPGCLILELQEPTDYTIRVEKTTPRGLQIEDRLCHQGIGFERMFDCFSYIGQSPEEVRESYKLAGAGQVLPDSETVLISWEDTPCFSLRKLRIDDCLELPPVDSFSVLVAAEGSGTILYPGGEMQIKPGDSVFLPAALGAVSMKNEGDHPLELLRCLPPQS